MRTPTPTRSAAVLAILFCSTGCLVAAVEGNVTAAVFFVLGALLVIIVSP